MAEVPNMPCEAKVLRSAVTPAPLDGSKPAMLRAILAPGESFCFLLRVPEDGGFAAAERFAGKPEANWGGLLVDKVGLRVEGALYHKAIQKRKQKLEEKPFPLCDLRYAGQVGTVNSIPNLEL